MALLREPLPGLSTFVRSIETGSFSAAARSLGCSPSAVSKAVSKLEAKVGVLLLQRTTRAVTPTSEGALLYERGQRLLDELYAACEEIRAARAPRGALHVTAPVDFGRYWLVPRLGPFLARYPEIRCRLSLTDRLIDLAHERIDVAVRMSERGEAGLVRRKLGASRAVVCAAPRYLERHGPPRRLADLAHHNCLTYVRDDRGGTEPWRMSGADIAVSGNFAADNNDALLAMAIAGAGLVRLPEFIAADAIRAGQLQVVLPSIAAFTPMTYVVYPERRHVAARLRVFIDFVVGEFEKTGRPRPPGSKRR